MAKDIIVIPVQIGAVLPDVAVKQGDAGSRLLRLCFRGRDDKPIDLTDHLVTLYAVKPDKTKEFASVSIPMPPQARRRWFSLPASLRWRESASVS